MRYDIVIVGGGSAGCALANRLSADGSTRVLVLEAGRPDYAWDVYIHMPAALSFPIGNRFYDWRYESEPEPHMNGRRIYHARGKVLGGSSSINGMIFQRGNPLDYERWASDPGMEAWDYAHCLPYFKRMETCMAGADTWLDQPASHTPCFSVGGRGDSPASSPTLDGDQQHPTGSAPSLSPSSFGAGATRCCSAPSSALQAFGVAQGRMNDADCPARSARQRA